jgi:glucose/arabinose dehydrogenase
MKNVFTCLASVFLCFNTIKAQSTLTIGSTSVVVDTVVTGLNVPWEIIYGPDGYIWMTERKGLVSRVDPVQKTITPILDITASTYFYAEAGLLGMALHPDFVTVKEVFLVYTYTITGGTQYERLVKYSWNGSSLVNQQILLDSITGNSFHDGSRLLFMADKTLLMTTGEAGNISLSQNLNSRNGKVLRLNPDGTVPSDNPFPGSYVYTYGHRNPQGLTRGNNGAYYISEHGPSNDDEFQVLEKGRNYGWPDVEGFCDLPAEISYCTAHNIKEPIVDWTPTIAPNDLVYYTNNSFLEFDNRFIMTTLKEKKLVAIQLNAAGTTSLSQASYLTGMFGRLRAICVGPNAEIYLATNGAEAANIDPDTHSLLVLRPPAPVVSIQELSRDPGIKVFPTIVKDAVFITTEKNTGEYSLTIRDLYGKICRQQTFSAPYSGNLSNLENGVYFLSVKSQAGNSNQYKIIIAK